MKSLTLLLIPLLFVSSCTIAGTNEPILKDTSLVNTGIINSGLKVVIDKPTGSFASSLDLPPEPDIILNNSTLGGIDSNNNGVRDDVEIFVHSRFTDSGSISLAMKYAKSYCQQASFVITGKREDIIGVTSLMLSPSDIQDKLGDFFSRELIQKVMNTPERKEQFTKITGMMFNPDYGIEAKTCVPPSTLFGIQIPPEPDIILNNSTLGGIDSNNNGVRDDVERMIACNIISANDYVMSIKIAKAYQNMLIDIHDNIPRDIMLNYWGDIACAEGNMDFSKYPNLSYSPERDITKATLNTPDRLSIYRKKIVEFGGFSGDELKQCPGQSSDGIQNI